MELEMENLIWSLQLISTIDFFYPLVEDPYMQGRIACCNVLSDIYAMGVDRPVDHMLMVLGISLEMNDAEWTMLREKWLLEKWCVDLMTVLEKHFPFFNMFPKQAQKGLKLEFISVINALVALSKFYRKKAGTAVTGG